jgi:hypothetical protein
MPVKDYPWNLDVFDSHRFRGYSHRPPPYPCEVCVCVCVLDLQ